MHSISFTGYPGNYQRVGVLRLDEVNEVVIRITFVSYELLILFYVVFLVLLRMYSKSTMHELIIL